MGVTTLLGTFLVYFRIFQSALTTVKVIFSENQQNHFNPAIKDIKFEIRTLFKLEAVIESIPYVLIDASDPLPVSQLVLYAAYTWVI